MSGVSEPSAAELLAPVKQLDELGCRIAVTHLALDHPELLQEILDRVPITNGGRWDQEAYHARLAAEAGQAAQ